jgi:hypothetical protein
VKVGSLSADEIDYEVSYQAGRSPLHLQVHLAGDHLVFAERKYRYEGGDPKVFKKIADSIVGVESQNPDATKNESQK